MKFPYFLLVIGLALGVSQNAYSLSGKLDKEESETTPSSIVVKQAEPEFVIDLRSNPTTGYSWFLGQYNSDLVQPIKKTYEPKSNGSIGSGGKEHWFFKLRAKAFEVPKVIAIEMIYARPWTLENGMTKTFRIVTQPE